MPDTPAHDRALFDALLRQARALEPEIRVGAMFGCPAGKEWVDLRPQPEGAHEIAPQSGARGSVREGAGAIGSNAPPWIINVAGRA